MSSFSRRAPGGGGRGAGAGGGGGGGGKGKKKGGRGGGGGEAGSGPPPVVQPPPVFQPSQLPAGVSAGPFPPLPQTAREKHSLEETYMAVSLAGFLFSVFLGEAVSDTSAATLEFRSSFLIARAVSAVGGIGSRA